MFIKGIKNHASVKGWNNCAVLDKNGGFTLLEVLINVVIFSITITSVLAV
jgi:prepilin-type N-terminal cleavage/methylation domain-containing protein